MKDKATGKPADKTKPTEKPTEKTITLYELEIGVIKQELKKLPNGYLVKRGQCYYEKTETVQKGITKNPHRIRQLARKAYLLQRLKHLEWNLSLAKEQCSQYMTEDQFEIIQNLSPSCKALPVSYFFHHSVHDQFESDSAIKAMKPGNAGNTIHSEGLVYFTNKGLCVRSKSERIIADTLDNNNILYSYESPLSLKGGIRYPDFTIYRPSDGKLFLWEHFGLMKNEDYRMKTNEKLAFYSKNGFFPFDNLICTYENDMQSPAYLQSIVEIFLVR